MTCLDPSLLIGQVSFNTSTAKFSRKQISTKFPNFILNFEEQMAPCNIAGRELSFEWSHHKISSTESKVGVTLQNSIKHSGSERVESYVSNKKIYQSRMTGRDFFWAVNVS